MKETIAMKKCPYCEKLIPNDSSYCEYCGKNVDITTDNISSKENSESPNLASVVSDNSGKKHKWIKTTLVTIGILAIIFTCFVVGVFLKNRLDSFDVTTGFYGSSKAIYYGLVAPQIVGEDIEECIYLNSESRTYSHVIGNYFSQGGYYQIKKNELTLQEYDGTTHKYNIVAGKYIASSKNAPATKVPRSNKFNSTVKDNNGHTVAFRIDGSATYDGKQASYVRDGYTIYIYLEEEDVTLTDFVVDGYLCSDTFLPTGVSEYTQGLAAYADLYYRQMYDENYSKADDSRLETLRLERNYSKKLNRFVIHEYR